jgi:hypothetical protein
MTVMTTIRLIRPSEAGAVRMERDVCRRRGARGWGRLSRRAESRSSRSVTTCGPRQHTPDALGLVA